ncbi:MAG: exodeoxyribonuclease V subunit alpha [Pontibacterium sp.]
MNLFSQRLYSDSLDNSNASSSEKAFSPEEAEYLRQGVSRSVIRELDYQFAQFLLAQGANKTQALFGLLTSAELALGHVCLDLTQLSNTLALRYRLLSPLWPLFDVAQLVGDTQQAPTDERPDGIVAVSELASEQTLAPLVLDQQRLYLRRYWQYEVSVAQALLSFSDASHNGANGLEGLNESAPLINALFANSTETVDWQKIAAGVALRQPLTLISGGPGTGKTTTVSKVLALLIAQHQAQSTKPMRIKLAAPTGKAAARLSESINGAMAQLAQSLPNAQTVLSQIPDHATTIHRLLGVIPNQPQFKHHRKNPLHLDLLVVDEASMIDLPMMAKLLAAVPSHGRIIFLGDHDQLSSVEAGGVLADLCAQIDAPYSHEQQQALAALGCHYVAPIEGEQGIAVEADQKSSSSSNLIDARVLLRKSYRFHDQSGIGYLAKAVNQGQGYQALSLFNKGYADIQRQLLDDSSYSQLISDYSKALKPFLQLANDPNATASRVLDAFADVQLLCALRRGPYGVEGLNQAIRRQLSRQQWFNMDSLWYIGRPVMVTQNDPSLKLFNGDIGVCLAEPNGQLKVWFAGSEGQQPRSFLPSRLPAVETVFAMTIHKSQGSEFKQVYLLLPNDDTPVVTRELLYTGITRAKKHCVLYANDDIVLRACQRKTTRVGGLARRLGLVSD